MSGNKISVNKKDLGVGTALTLASLAMINKQYNDGNLTGRELLYHNTDKKNVDSIRNKGILKSRSYDKDNLTHKELKGVVRTKDMRGLTYMAKTPAPALGVGAGAALNDSRNNNKNIIKAMSDRRTLKARVPAWRMETVENPELMGTKGAKDFAPIIARRFRKGIDRESYPGKLIKPVDYVQAAIMHKNLGPDKTYTFTESIKPKYVKGSSKYESADLDEIKEYIKNNPGRFTKGILGTAIGAGGATVGTSILKNSIKKVASEGIEKTAINKSDIIKGVLGATLLYNSPDLMFGKKKAYHGTSSNNWESIKETGFKSEFGGKGVSSIDKKLKGNSRGSVHVTATKPIATYHAAMMGRPHKFKTTNLRLQLNAEKRRLEQIKKPSQKTLDRIEELDTIQKALFPLSQKEFRRGHFISPGKDAKIIKLKMDYDKFKNMEVDRDLPMNKAINEKLGPKGDFIAKQIAAKGPVDIPIEEIRGSNATPKQKVEHTLKTLPSYIKNNPARFASGVGSAGAGALLLRNALRGVK